MKTIITMINCRRRLQKRLFSWRFILKSVIMHGDPMAEIEVVYTLIFRLEKSDTIKINRGEG